MSEEIKKRIFQWRPPGHEGVFSIHVEELGSGRRHVVLIHGFGGNSYTFRMLAPLLAGLGYRVWNVDLLGFGKSCKPLDVPYSFPFFADSIHAMMDAFRIKQAHLIGHSMGGGISLALAQSYPERVRSLILIASAGIPFKIPITIFSTFRLMVRLAPSVMRPMLREVLHWLVIQKEAISDEMIHAYYQPMQSAPGAHILFAVLKAFKHSALEKLASRFNEVEAPALLVWGRQDPLISLDRGQELSAALRCSHLHVLDHCGHLPHEERPLETLEAILEFLKRPQRFIQSRRRHCQG